MFWSGVSTEWLRWILWQWHVELEMICIQVWWKLTAELWFTGLTCAAASFYKFGDLFCTNLPAITNLNKRADTDFTKATFRLMAKYHKRAQTLTESKVGQKNLVKPETLTRSPLEHCWASTLSKERLEYMPDGSFVVKGTNLRVPS